MQIRRGVATCVAALALLVAGCGGDDDEGGGGSAGGDGGGETLTVWNNEFQPDRMAGDAGDPRRLHGEDRRSRPSRSRCPEDQLATLMTNAAAAGELPDVVLGTPLDQSQQYAAEEIFDAEAAQAVVDKLGADTFSQKALDLVSRDGVATGVPSDGWGQLLIYRKDLFDKAGLKAPKTLDDVEAAAAKLNGDGMAGHHARHEGRRRLHRRDVRARRARLRLPARGRRRQGHA